MHFAMIMNGGNFSSKMLLINNSLDSNVLSLSLSFIFVEVAPANVVFAHYWNKLNV